MADTITFADADTPDEEMRTDYRAGGTVEALTLDLGLLAQLPGDWRGHGFNLTARPFFGNAVPFFLELNATRESLDFTAISGDVPNRGSVQKDIFLHGLRYLQQVTDVVQDTGIHIETGMWMRIPPTTDPAQTTDSYVRQSTIPHGDALLAQTIFTTTVAGGPLINPVLSVPFTDTVVPPINGIAKQPITKPEYLAQYNTDKLPPHGMPPGMNAAATIADPTLVLKEHIKGQKINKTIVLNISTALPNSTVNTLVNIPFVTKNANATQLDAIFWIEFVERPNGRIFVQLQYVQRVILDFIGIKWPHVSVATLKRL